MRTTKNIVGVLEKGQILAREDNKALVSRLTILCGSYSATFPFYGPITEREIELLRGSPVRFEERQRGFWSKEVHQTLEGNGIRRAMTLPRSRAHALARKFYPEAQK